jgi:hypothetical protein
VSFTNGRMTITLTTSYSWISNSNTAYWTGTVFKLVNAVDATEFAVRLFSLPSFGSVTETFPMRVTGNYIATVDHETVAATRLDYVPDNSIFRGPPGIIYSLVFLFTFYP